MKVGVIGAGYWGKKHVDEYTQMGSEVVVSDLVEGNLKACAEKFGAQTTKNHMDILNDKTIEAVSICTPNSTHYALCAEAIKAGKHVMLEKPMTLEYKSAVGLVKMAEKAGSVLAVGHLYRFNNAVLKLKDMVAAGDFGDVRMVKTVWTNMEPVFPDRDILFDLAIHPFDIVNFIFGRSPENTFCLARGFRQGHEEAAFISGALGRAMINFELSWVTPDKVRDLVLVGADRTAFVKLVAQKMVVRGNETGKDADIEIAESNTIRKELENFLGCVDGGGQPVSSGRVGAEIVRVIEGIKRM